jgi:hypothetical protein
VILFLVSSAGAWRMRRFLRNWAPELRERVVTVPYSQLPRLVPLPKATVIFADIDSLEGGELDYATVVYRELAAERPPRLILNEPGRTLTRHDLLEKLYREEINKFAVRRLIDASETRFPAFLRSARGHRGTLTPLLHDERELEDAIVHLKRVRLGDVLVVEFFDTSDDSGIFRKYSAFRVGQHIVPVHVLFSRYWMQRRPDLLDPSKVEEEHRFLRDNPHRAQLLRLFQAAGAEYGRIDYGISGSGIQTWEINTNPVIMLEPWQYSRGRLPNARRYAQALIRAFEDIDEEDSPPARQWRLKRNLVCSSSQLPPAMRTEVGLGLLRMVRPAGRLPAYAGRRLRRSSSAPRS